MDGVKVFVSYTGNDLAEHARVVRDQIRKLRWVAVDHDDWSATGRPSVATCREEVRGCAVLVVLVAHRYGWVPSPEEGGDGERSITWLEVEEARAHGLEVLPFLVREDAPWSPPLIEALRDAVAGERLGRFGGHLRQTVAGFFSSPESLAQPVFQALTEAGDRLEGRRRAAAARDAGGAAAGAAGPGGVAGAGGAAGGPGDPMTRYRRRVEERYRHFELLGFGEQLNVRMAIDEVYVPLRATLARALAGRACCGRYDDDTLTREAEHVERDVDLAAAFRTAQRFGGGRGVALLGDPGSGKTTAARYLVWRCADPVQGPESLGLPEGTVPVLLPLRRLLAKNLGRGLRGFLADELATVHLSDAADLGARLYERGGLLWVLDGLDEVADERMRADVSRWIEDALAQRPGDHFLVTSRYAGYEGEAVLGSAFLELHVQPLDDGEVETFVRRWYRVVEHQVKGDGATAARAASEQSDALVALLQGPDYRSQRLASMVANPLLLAILCLVHREHLELPRRRSELYGRCTDVLLKHWRAGKKLRGFDTMASRAVLAPLAWWMHQQEDRTEAPIDELVREAGRPLGEVAAQAGLPTDPKTFLMQLCDECGLIVRPRPGYLAFLHLSFQEYLAAVHAASEPRHARTLAGHFGESWWREVILLALGQGTRSVSVELFGAALRDGRFTADAELAGHCLEDALHVPVDRFVRALGDPDAPGERSAALLRLLQGRRDEELLAVAADLAKSGEGDVGRQARELLLRAGVPVEAPRVEGGAPAPGTERVHERTGVVFVYVPAGSFQMGAEDLSDREKPIHPVRLSGFWMGKYPVTNAEYAKFLEANPGHGKPGYWTDSKYNAARQPVVGVPWHDAVDYCRWAEALLPAEAQWEYACRAETTSAYWSGDAEGDLARVGWYRSNSDGRLHAVGEKPANPWGLHDLHGNVWEWCADEWAESYAGREGGVVVAAPPPLPAGPAAPGADRVIRGGGWGDVARWARSACRSGGHPWLAWNVQGFRLVLPAAPSSGLGS